MDLRICLENIYKMSVDLETKIEQLCTLIMKAADIEWESKNKSVLQIIELIRAYDGQPSTVIQEAFTPNIYRSLKEPVKLLVHYYRSWISDVHEPLNII